MEIKQTAGCDALNDFAQNPLPTKNIISFKGD